MSLSNSILKSVNVIGNFVENVGLVRVTQEYLNTNTVTSAEAIYNFDLDASSTINSFVMQVGEKVTIGQVKEKTQATKEYTDAKEAGIKTSILDKISDTSYRVKIAGINPGETVSITYEYAYTLEMDGLGSNGRYKFVLPTNIAPKYTGSSNKTIGDSVFSKAMEKITYSNSPGYTFEITLNFSSKKTIEFVGSLTNKIDIKIINLNSVQVSSTTSPVGGDFNVLLDIKPGSSLHCYEDTNTKDKYYMVTHTIPDQVIEVPQPKNYYFFLDRSGSMGCGGKMTQAVNALKSFITQLDENSYFNVISFGTSFSKLTPGLARATPIHKGYSKRIVEDYSANMGGTEIYPCLEYALTDTIDNPYEKIFVFLTDGQVSNVQAISKLIKSHSNVRIFSVGIGSDADRNLVRLMAEQSAGDYKFVVDAKNLEACVTSIASTVNKQYYTNVRFGDEWIVYPSVYAGKTYDFVGKNMKDFKLKGSNPITNESFEIDLSLQLESNASETSNFTPQIYGNVLIKYLQTLNSTPELIDQIVKVSVDYQIMSKYTSYILVDSEVSVKSPDQMKEQVVPHYLRSFGDLGDSCMLESCAPPSRGYSLQRGGMVGSLAKSNESCKLGAAFKGKSGKHSASKSVLESLSNYSMALDFSFFSTGSTKSSDYLRSPAKIEEVESLDGGMDMFGGGSKKSHKSNVKSLDLVELVKKQAPDGSFDLTYHELGYDSIAEYANAKIESGLSSAKLFASALMYGYLKNSSLYKKEFTKLFDWITKYYSDIEFSTFDKIYLSHVKMLGTSSSVGCDDY